MGEAKILLFAQLNCMQEKLLGAILIRQNV